MKEGERLFPGFRARAGLAAALAPLLVAACAGGPPPPDWQANAKGAMDHAVAAYLAGDSRAAAQDFARARGEAARTGRPDLVARVELMRCAASTASLVFEPCEGFEKLRVDAAAPEKAYAAHLAAQALPRADIDLLPPAQRPVAALVAAAGEAAPADLQAIGDPLSRLIAAAVLFKAGKASPAVMAQAADAASLQGWRRPLLAWLKVQALHAQRAGLADEAQRLQRRIELVQGGP